MALVPVLVIVAILAVVAVLGFGTSDSVGKKQIEREVTALLSGIPQSGAVLGSPRAPVTVSIYGDMECPTVKLFVEKYLPSIVETWVRPGDLRLHYRSLETDTADEEVFFKQEIAALAAGKQDKMWNFLLTFVRQQGRVRTDYVTEEFLADIASQTPELGLAKWRRDRGDALLSKQVALGVYFGHANELRYTPSFLIGFTEGKVNRRPERESIEKGIESAIRRSLASLGEETRADFPTIGPADPDASGG